MYSNFDGAKLEVQRKCPHARNFFSSSLISACNGNYRNCKIKNCPRRLI